MRRAAFALGLSLAIAAPSVAQLPSPLELVRKLRESGMVDLAVLRLEELKNKPGALTKDELALVTLELARIRLEEASREGDDARRANLLGQARMSFDEFIRNNPTHPMAAQANVEIARLYALQAKGQLSRANRGESREAKALGFSRARPDFTNAINRYKKAIADLEARVKTVDEKDKLHGELARSKAQAELDAAVLQYDFALTYVGEDETKQRGENIDKAKAQFNAIESKYQNNRIGYLAHIWGLQCAHLNGDTAKALPAMEKFVNANRPNRDAADAIRLAAFFGIEHTFEADTGKDTPAAKFLRTEKAAEQWLKTYPEARNTPEGLGAQYRRALMKEMQALMPGNIRFADPPKAAKTKDKDPPPAPKKIVGITPTSKQLLEEANKIYKDLADSDNEYSDRAQRKRLVNQLVILEGEGRGGDPPVKSINTLEQAYLAAQVQQARIFELHDPSSKLTDKQVEAEEKRRNQNAVAYLERGLRLAGPKDTPRDVFDAQMLLVQFLTKVNRAAEAAVLGEALARNNPKVPKASVAALLAVYAYNTALGDLKERTRDTGGDEVGEEADVRRIKALAEFAQTTWPTDGPTDGVRHVLGFYQWNRDKDYEAAWQTYSKIGAGYPDLYQARREMAAAMFFLIRPDTKDAAKFREGAQKNITDRAQQFRTTLAALEALPEPPAGASAHDAEAWAGAKSMQAQLYYLAADYARVDATIKAVVDGVKRFGALDDRKKDDLAYTARALRYNALQGRAAEFIRAKEFAKVGSELGGELTALKDELKKDSPAETPPGFDRMRKAQREFLIAAMSAYLQNKQADQAGELLDVLQASGKGGSLDENLAVMRQLVAAIRGQVDSLRKDNKKAEADELSKNFTEFLDKVKGDDTSKLPQGVILFLGQGYGAVDKHAKAAELFGQLLAKTDPAKDAVYHRQLKFLQAQAYRQAGQFDQAKALMLEIVGEPLNPKGARGWGWRNVVIRKEYCLLWEDQKNFTMAGRNWTQLLAERVPRGTLPAQVKFVALRPQFLAFAGLVDATFGTPVEAMLSASFKGLYPAVAEQRAEHRRVYFDLFYETYRCAARGFTTVGPPKGKGPEYVDQALANYGQKFYELLTRNDDVPSEVKEKIQDLMEKYPQMKKKFDELTAAGPKS